MISCIRERSSEGGSSPAAAGSLDDKIYAASPPFLNIARRGARSTERGEIPYLTAERFRIAQVAFVEFHILFRQIARVEHATVATRIEKNVQIEFRFADDGA